MATLLRERKKSFNYFLGLDLSLTGTGIVVLDKKAQVIYSETLSSKLIGMERLELIEGFILDIIQTFPPKITVIENYSMGSRAGQAFSIGELGGVIKLLLHKKGITPWLVPPTRLKKFITGGGRAEKDMILLKVFQNWRFEAGDNNQADAYGLARIALEINSPSEKLTKARQEVLNDIVNPPPKKRR